MGCSAATRLAAQVALTKSEIEQLKKDIKASAESRQVSETDLLRARISTTSLIADNERLKHDLILSMWDGGQGNASVFESAKEEQEQMKEWIEFEVREGNTVLASVLKLHGSDETGQIAGEVAKQTGTLEESEYQFEKLSAFTQWKYKQMRSELEGLMDDRHSWVEFLTLYEEDIKLQVDQTDRSTGGKVRPQLAEIKAKLARLPSAAQPLARLKALRDLEKGLSMLSASSSSDVDAESKDTLGKQAEELKVLTQRLAAQKKVEEERKQAAEKELSLKEVHIKHLENKVKDLSRPSIADSEVKVKERELERLRGELAKIRQVQKTTQDSAETLEKTNEELAEEVQAQEEELQTLRAGS